MTTRLIPLLLCAAACTNAGERTTAETVTIEPSIALDLAMGDSDSVLVGALQDATRLSDGRIALLDADRKAIVLVTPGGATIGTSGREGSGPGEYRFPTFLGRCAADSLYVWDMGQARISILAPDGTHARQMQPHVAAAFRPECLPNGNLVSLDAGMAAGAPRAVDGKAALITGALTFMSPDGDSVAAVPGLVLGESKVLGQLAGIAVTDDRVVIGLNSSPELVSYDFSGSVVGHDTVAITPVPYADARYEAMVAAQSGATGGDSTVRAMLRETILAEGKPELAPLFSGMHGAPDGTVWWVTSLPVDSVTTLVGFRQDTATRRLTLPAGVEVFEIGSDYLLGKRTDASGFERLVLWRW